MTRVARMTRPELIYDAIAAAQAFSKGESTDVLKEKGEIIEEKGKKGKMGI